MKLICETCTINRTVPVSKRTFQKTILAIGKGSERKTDEPKIMLITRSNNAGTKYGVLNNINKIFTRFVDEGKVTISFTIPAHDVQIKSDQVQLKAFLKVLKLVLTGGGQPAQTVQSITNSSTPSAPLRLPCLTIGKKKTSILDSASTLSSKCVIKNRKDYPSKGFSRLLTTLIITDIKLARLDSQILLLHKLQVLNLSNNCIRTLPRALGKLRLKQLEVCGNSLTACNWEWLLESNIQSSLVFLDISQNELSFLPIYVLYASNLETLMANNNHIRKLPFALYTLTRLRTLTLAGNRIDAVPETMSRIYLDQLDLSANELHCDNPTEPDLQMDASDSQHRQPSSLFEAAARTVIFKKVPYASPGKIPFTVLEMLRRAPLCGCGVPCFNSKVYLRSKVLKPNCSCLTMSNNQQLWADCVFCSEKCFRKMYNVSK